MAFLCGVANMYLALGILNPTDSFVVVWRMIVLGDVELWEMDGLSDPLQPARYDAMHYVVRIIVMFGTFLFGLSLLNVFIAVLTATYAQGETNQWRVFYQQRAIIAKDHLALRLCLSTVLKAKLEPLVPKHWANASRRILRVLTLDLTSPSSHISLRKLPCASLESVDQEYMWVARAGVAVGS